MNFLVLFFSDFCMNFCAFFMNFLTFLQKSNNFCVDSKNLKKHETVKKPQKTPKAQFRAKIALRRFPVENPP